MKQDAQWKRVLTELQRREWVSLADALALDPPIYRLSERVRELVAQGHNIISRRVEGKPYNEYHLAAPIRQPAPITLPPPFKEIPPKFTIEKAAQNQEMLF